jgi:hypothetical protein
MSLTCFAPLALHLPALPPRSHCRDDLDSIHAELACIARPAALLSSDFDSPSIESSGGKEGGTMGGTDQQDLEDWESLAEIGEEGNGQSYDSSQQEGGPHDQRQQSGHASTSASTDDHVELSLRDVATVPWSSPMESGSSNK